MIEDQIVGDLFPQAALDICDTYNLSELAVYEELILEQVAANRIEYVVEIGVNKGDTYKFLQKRLDSIDRYYLVDPSPHESCEQLVEGNKFVVLCRKTSFAFLEWAISNGEFTDKRVLFLVDGDHTYKTVRKELSLISRLASDFTAIMIHDTSWPCARRDMSYNEIDKINPQYRTNTGICLEELAVGSHAFPSGDVYSYKQQYGGQSNGVKTAVEEFLADRNESKGFSHVLSTPIFYGLMILVKGSCEHSTYNTANHFRSLDKFLQSCEVNRLRLIQGLHETEAELSEKKRELEVERISNSNMLGELNERINALEAELAREKEKAEDLSLQILHKSLLSNEANSFATNNCKELYKLLHYYFCHLEEIADMSTCGNRLAFQELAAKIERALTYVLHVRVS